MFQTKYHTKYGTQYLIILYIEDADAEHLYENDGTLMLIDRLLFDEETFFDLI